MKTVNLIAPAKVNLFLGIGAKRADGYHDVTTVMHALSMHDKIQMTLISAGEHVKLVEPNDLAQPEREIEIDVKPGDGLGVGAVVVWRGGVPGTTIADEDNLACKAVRALAETLGRNADEYVRLVIEKHIPHQTGLGGGSSDAAAALLGAADLWGVSPDDPAVAETARKLGADVAFFLKGGSALLQGRGDELVRELAPRRDSVVILRPQDGVSTAEAYRAFDDDPHLVDDAVLEKVGAVTDAAQVPLHNNLEPAAESLLGGLAEAKAFAAAAEGVTDALLCGSGSGIFAVCRDMTAAQKLARTAQLKGYWARTTSFSPIRAAILPDK